MNYKRSFKLLTILILCLVFMVGCSPIPNKNERKVLSGFAVHYIDVGQGDCIFINLPDEKTVMIDCGANEQSKLKTITDFLSTYSVKTIDYFILTHPDTDHVGNAISIIENYSIGKIYHPYIIEQMLDLSQTYKMAIQLAQEKNIELNVSDSFDFIKGEDYQLVFLSPNPLKVDGSAYHDYLSTATPLEKETNNLSPIIYLEYSNVRFLFTGDAGKKQETIAVNNISLLSSHYNYYGLNVNINNVDFLKVSHHGSNDSTGRDFLQVIQPKNAIVSVGGENYYGHPSTELLTRLLECNSDYKLFRTDVNGTISVGVDKFGRIEIVKDN